MSSNHNAHDNNSTDGTDDALWAVEPEASYSTAADDDFSSDGEAVAESHEEEAGEGEEPPAKDEKKKPNVAILAAAGAMVLVVLGGLGFFVKTKLFPSKPIAPIEMPVSPMAEPSSTKPSSVFDEPKVAAVPGAPASGSVFDAPVVSPALNNPALAASHSAPTVAPPVSPIAASSSLSPQSLAMTAPVTAKPVIPAVPVVAPVVAIEPATPVVTPKKPAVLKTRIIEPSTENTTHQSVHAVHATATHKVHTAKVHASVSAKKKAASGVESAKNEPQPEISKMEMPGNLKVMSIYPQTGTNVQAWVSDGASHTEIVRVGDKLRSGAIVKSISPEKGEIVTTSGVITSRGGVH